MAVALRITLKGRSVILEALLADRFVNHGFGTFLEGVGEGEIEITHAALDEIVKCPYRSGVQGLEIFGIETGGVIAWASTSPRFEIPLQHVSKHQNSDWFRERATVLP
jgi:hypothetical protein